VRRGPAHARWGLRATREDENTQYTQDLFALERATVLRVVLGSADVPTRGHYGAILPATRNLYVW
jgi:hypothetical protein